MATQLTTFVPLYSCNNNITLKMATNSSPNTMVRKLWIKYIKNIVVYFVGYLCIMDLFNVWKMENIKAMKFILGNLVNVINSH